MDFSKLYEEREALIAKSEADMAKAVDSAKFDDAGKAEFNKVKDRVAELDGLIEAAKFAAANKRASGKVVDNSSFDNKVINSIAPDEKAEFANFLRTSRIEFAAGTITAAGNSVVIPTSVQPPVEIRRLGNVIRKALADAGVPTIYNPNTASMQLPLSDDTANSGSAQDEAAVAGTESRPTYSEITGLAGGHMLANLSTSEQEWYSNTAILANGFDITSYVIPRHYKRLDRRQENLWFTKVKTGTVGVQTASATAITYDEYMDWLDSLAVEYREDSVMFLSGFGYKLLRKVKTTTGEPVLDTNPASGVTLLDGKRIYLTSGLDGSGTNKYIGALASVEALKVYDAGPDRVKVYVDNPARPDQQGYEIFRNGDFGFVTNGVRLLKTAAA